MKLRLLLLGLSMVGHLLAGYYFLIALPRSETSPATPSRSTQDVPTPSAISSASSVPPGPAAAFLSPELWQRLDQPELTAFVAKLREAGFPPSTIRALAAYKLEGELNTLKASIGYPNETAGYWEKPDKATKAQRDAVALFQTEADQRLRSALGHDEINGEADFTRLTQRWGNFPTEKLRVLNAIEQDYREIFTASMSESSPGESPGDLYALLEKERTADIAAALGPDDFLEYQLRHSQLASSLRRTFGSAQLSETEFRTLFQAVDTAATSTQANVDSAPAAPALQTVFRNPLGDPKTLDIALGQLGATLPADRIADLQQLSSPTAFQENRLVQRLGLPLSAAATLASRRDEMQTLLNNANRGPVDAQQQATIVARVQTIDDEIKTLLGPEGYAAIQTQLRGRYPTPDQVAANFARRSPPPPTGG